jgi:hypothetical protein
MLEKSRPVIFNMTRKESTALWFLKKEQANANSTSWQRKLHGSVERVHLQGLESGGCEILRKDPTSQIERKIRKLLTKHKTVLPAALKHKLTRYHSKPSHLYGLPKIHKPDIPLRPIVSSVDSPCYALAEILNKILSPLVAIQAPSWRTQNTL